MVVDEAVMELVFVCVWFAMVDGWDGGSEADVHIMCHVSNSSSKRQSKSWWRRNTTERTRN